MTLIQGFVIVLLLFALAVAIRISIEMGSSSKEPVEPPKSVDDTLCRTHWRKQAQQNEQQSRQRAINAAAPRVATEKRLAEEREEEDSQWGWTGKGWFWDR